MEAIHSEQGEFSVTEVNEGVVTDLLHTLNDGRVGAGGRR